MTTRAAIEPELILDILTTEFEVPADTAVDTDFESLDLDSLVLVELAVMLTKQYDVEVAGDELVAAGTAAKVAELLSAKVMGG
ncbi:acyl carrier protein [Streptomyces sp. SBT349]|uniref:acyl carrier protein n=1 Tax=Streptomyces sp. SBT349 TaxID=1580539 RepID=UPI0007C76EAB|nr:acyl carrier protein [Streptomyces sp. SBT349]